MPMLLPRMLHRSASDVVSRSWPSNVIVPVVWDLVGSSPMVAKAVSDFPDPLSPVTATISPVFTDSDTSRRMGVPLTDSDMLVMSQ